MLAIRLPQDIEARLDDLAKRTGRTKSFYGGEAILEYLGDLEDRYLAEQAPNASVPEKSRPRRSTRSRRGLA